MCGSQQSRTTDWFAQIDDQIWRLQRLLEVEHQHVKIAGKDALREQCAPGQLRDAGTQVEQLRRELGMAQELLSASRAQATRLELERDSLRETFQQKLGVQQVPSLRRNKRKQRTARRIKKRTYN